MAFRMDQRKNEIRRRLTIAKTPKRAQAVFNDENDHNPIVLQNCPACFGRGKRCEHSSPNIVAKIDCPDCQGEGITGETEHYFTNNSPPQSARQNRHGWIQCPKCGIRFKTSDPNAWTGRRHLACGQKIIVEKIDQD